MNTEQLQRAIKSDSFLKDLVQGIYASDTLPSTVKKYPSAYIVNTDPAWKPGRHWVAFYFRDRNNAEFFDSFGRKPGHYSETFEAFLENNSRHVQCNDKRLQQNYSQTCGYYVLFYLFMKCLKVSLHDIVHIFSEDKRQNDVYVFERVIHHFDCK